MTSLERETVSSKDELSVSGFPSQTVSLSLSLCLSLPPTHLCLPSVWCVQCEGDLLTPQECWVGMAVVLETFFEALGVFVYLQYSEVLFWLLEYLAAN